MLDPLPPRPEPYMSTPDVSEYVQLPVKTVRQHAASGSLKATRVGKYLRFRRDDVDAWMARGASSAAVEHGQVAG